MDIRTEKKILSILFLIFSFALVMCLLLLSAYKEINPMVFWCALALHVVQVGVFFKKKIKASKDGVELEDQ